MRGQSVIIWRFLVLSTSPPVLAYTVQEEVLSSDSFYYAETSCGHVKNAEGGSSVDVSLRIPG